VSDIDNESESREISQQGDAEPDPDPSLMTDPVCNVADIFDDPAEWTVDDELRERLINRPIKQNMGDFSRSERVGKKQKWCLPPSLFRRKMANGELVKREWLVYSPSTGRVFC
jgi:hypothetical protein